MSDKQKKCSNCNETKPIDAFGLDKAYLDGRRNKCKKCRQEWWNKNAYPKQKANPQYKEQHKRAQATYISKNPEKGKAHKLARANKDKIKKDLCENCNSSSNLHMHHPDYSKPLDVVTLCVPCHEEVHHGAKL